jgi:hypothetical protein
MAVFLMTTANVIMTYALFWLHGGSYMQHMKAVKDAKLAQNIEPLTSLSIRYKSNPPLLPHHQSIKVFVLSTLH